MIPKNNSELIYIPSVIVTWGVNPLGEYTFARVPRTRDEAISEGYDLQSSGCEGMNTTDAIGLEFFSLLEFGVPQALQFQSTV